MRTTFSILLMILASCFPLKAQHNSFKLGTRIQLSTGGVVTRTEKPHVGPFSPNREFYYGFQQSIQVSVFVPVKIINIGLGAGMSFRNSNNPSKDTYHSSIYPKIFVLLEIGNATKRFPFSFILYPGIMKGPVEKKVCFYIGLGPSFNIGRKFSKVTVSINPYVEYHGGEKKELKYYDTRYGYPGTEMDYSLHYKTITFNLSCIVQFNFNRTPQQKTTN